MTFHIVLYQPEIPPNTGNIIRLAANTGAHLHLIYPLGFTVNDKALQRAGLDYHDWANIHHHKDYASFIALYQACPIVTVSTKATTYYHNVHYEPNTFFLFGRETAGLPQDILDAFPSIKIPMQPNQRSLNLSNAVSVVIYEAYRQKNFPFLD